MVVHIVTSKAQETDTDGTILSVKVRFYGVFTSETRAQEIADKYGGDYVSVDTDIEKVPQDEYVLQRWVNPGYASG